MTGNNGALSENTSRSNGGVGFDILSSGHKLTKNIAGGTASQNNGGCEFVINASNTDGTGNKANNNPFTFTSGGRGLPGVRSHRSGAGRSDARPDARRHIFVVVSGGAAVFRRPFRLFTPHAPVRICVGLCSAKVTRREYRFGRFSGASTAVLTAHGR